MSKIEMLFFGCIAAVVLLSWLNTALRRQRRYRYLRYRYPVLPAPPAQAHPDQRDRTNLSAVLIMGLVLLATAMGLVKVKERYTSEWAAGEDQTLSSSLANYDRYEPGPPGPEEYDSYSPMDAPRKRGVYTPQPPAAALPASEALPSESELTGYGLQVAALTDQYRAALELESVQSLLPGLEVQLGKVLLNGSLYYKVLVGFYPDARSARSDLVKLRKHYPKSFLVELRQVKLL